MAQEHDRVNEVYLGSYQGGQTTERLRKRLHWMCQQVSGTRVLDVGCSQGMVAILLAREAHEVVGLDLDEVVIAQAQEALAKESPSVQARVSFLVGNILDADLHLGRFDSIVVGEILEHMVQPGELIARCRELLNPNGLLILTTPFGIVPHPDHKQVFHLSAVLDLLGPQFRIERLDTIGHWLCLSARVRAKASAASAADVWEWLRFSDRTFSETEERYVAQVASLRKRADDLDASVKAARAELQERLAAAEQLRTQLQTGHNELSREVLALQDRIDARQQIEQSLRDQVAAAAEHATDLREQRERALTQLQRAEDQLAQGLTEAHQRASAEEAEWQARLAEADRQMAALAQEWLQKLEGAEAARTGAEGEWQQRLAAAEQAYAEVERLTAAEAAEWQARLAEADRQMAALAQEWLQKLETADAGRARAEAEWQQRLAAAEQAHARAERLAIAEATEWETRLAETDRQMAALAHEWLQKLEAAAAAHGQAEREWQARWAEAEQKTAALMQEWRRKLQAAEVAREQAEQARAEVERLTATEAAEWQVRLAEADRQTAALSHEWLRKLEAAETGHAEAEEEWQRRLAAAQQARTDVERLAAIEAAEWQARLAEADRLAAALAQEWLQKLEAAAAERAQAEAEWQARLAEAEQQFAALTRAQASREDELQTQIASLRNERRRVEETLKRQLTAADESRKKVEQALEEREKLLNQVQQSLASLRGQHAVLLQELEAWEKAFGQARDACKDRDRMILQLARRLAMMEDATSYRVGLLLVRALQRPYRLLTLPVNLTTLLAKAARRKLARGKRKPEPRYAELPRELVALPEPPARRAHLVADPTRPLPPLPASAEEIAMPAVAAPILEEESSAMQLLLSGSYGKPRTVSALKVAAILDEFSLECFRPDCQIITFRPDNWEPVLKRERPHLLLVESAWRGNGGSWEYRVANSAHPGFAELERIVLWCRQHGIPTVFWNKEDPVHFDRFLGTAKIFDLVLTTDANCVPKYRAQLGHARVHALPFAAQPKLHNPIRVPGYRQRSVCFAGSYYRDRHEQRRAEMEWLLDAAMEFGLQIYDRAYGRNGPGVENLTFPERFVPAIVGGASYREIVKVYKQYRAFLNVNSVTDSPTMFSRRVFELLACGTPVVSTSARGIEELIGNDVVQMVTSQAHARETLHHLLSNDEWREQLGLEGQRRIARGHTYAHRLQELAGRAGYRVELPRASVSVITWTNGAPNPADSLAALTRQATAPINGVVVCSQDQQGPIRELLQGVPWGEQVELLTVPDPADGARWWKAALQEVTGEYLAVFSPYDSYGDHYLDDLLRALDYAEADIVGKPNRLAPATCEYSFVPSVTPSAMIARREVLQELGWLGDRREDGEALYSIAAAGARIFATDRFNYRPGEAAKPAS